MFAFFVIIVYFQLMYYIGHNFKSINHLHFKHFRFYLWAIANKLEIVNVIRKTKLYSQGLIFRHLGVSYNMTGQDQKLKVITL